MQLFINQIVGSLLQIILFSAVPLIWWYATARREQHFWTWIGFQPTVPSVWKYVLALFFIILALAWVLSPFLPLGTLSAASEFKSLGASALPAAFVYAVFHTALPEEIFFRGFLLKRLHAKLGFRMANIIQAVVFGLVHGLLFGLMGATPTGIIVVSLLPFGIALGMGWLNEQKGGGSVLPSWTVHALANLTVSFAATLT